MECHFLEDWQPLSLPSCVVIRWTSHCLVCAMMYGCSRFERVGVSEEFDPVLSRSVSAVMEMTDPEQIEYLCLSFPQDDEKELTFENRDEFKVAMVYHHTIGDVDCFSAQKL